MTKSLKTQHRIREEVRASLVVAQPYHAEHSHQKLRRREYSFVEQQTKMVKSLQEDLRQRDQMYEEALRHQVELRTAIERVQAEKEAEMRKQSELKAEIATTQGNKETEMRAARGKLLQLEVS